MLRLSLMILFASAVLCPLSAQDFNPVVKTMDGRLDDWGNGKHWTVSAFPNPEKYLFDNEAQGDIRRNYLPGTYVSGPDNDKDDITHHPGDSKDEPLNQDLMFLTPLGSGFNLVSALIAFDPGILGGTYYLAFDLPGPTNDNLSDGFWNEFIEIAMGEKWYPIPFDCDCNENRSLVDSIESGGHGSIANKLDDVLYGEDYIAFLWVGADPEDLPDPVEKSYYLHNNHTGSWSENILPDCKANPLGFPVLIRLSNEFLTADFTWCAMIPGSYTLSGENLILGDSDPSTPDLGLVTHSEPMIIPENDPNRPNPQYDIEVSITGIMSVIFPLIDVNSVGYAMTEFDLYHAMAVFLADSGGDFSDEDWIFVGLDATSVLMRDAPEISATGGTVNFHLNAGSSNAGKNYIMLGGVTGTYPGYPLPGGNVTLPLNWDLFTDLALSLANTILFPGFIGTTDGNGQSTAQLYWPGPSLPPGSVGTIMYFAYCLGWPWEFASNPVEIEIIP